MTPRHLHSGFPRAIERALDAMTDVMLDRRLPLETRQSLCKAHALLHACRSPGTVKRMEREQGLR